MNAPQPAAISLRGVGVRHGRQPAVDDVDADFARGRLHAIVGPNGAGKSSLMHALAGLQPHTGRIDVAADLQPRIGYLPQRSQVDRGFPLSAADFAAMGLWPRLGAFRGLAGSDTRSVADVLGRLGLLPLRHRLIGELSTGQFQRLLFARLCLQDAALLLLDEPFAALDEDTTADLMRLLHAWRAEGRTVIAVLHEQALVRSHFDSALLLAGGVVAQGDAAQALSPDAWRRAERLLAARSDRPCLAA